MHVIFMVFYTQSGYGIEMVCNEGLEYACVH